MGAFDGTAGYSALMQYRPSGGYFAGLTGKRLRLILLTGRVKRRRAHEARRRPGTRRRRAGAPGKRVYWWRLGRRAPSWS